MRISHVLERQFETLIDMTDWANKPEADRKKAFLSRAVAALCVKSLALVDLDVAAAAVTDGFQDNGLDAVYFDQNHDTLILVQSKWSADGSKPMDAEGANAFESGIREIMQARFDRFNAKVRSKEAQVKAALFSDRPIKFLFVTAHTAAQPTADFVKRKIDELVEELNDPVVIADAKHLDQAGIYALITAESEPQKIKLQVTLKDWGVIEKPFLAYYGRVHVNEIVDWWKSHQNALFTQKPAAFSIQFRCKRRAESDSR
jgi:hypothetical protein